MQRVSLEYPDTPPWSNSGCFIQSRLDVGGGGNFYFRRVCAGIYLCKLVKLLIFLFFID